MSKETESILNSQEEMFQLVRDGFYVSSGSTTAHALFIRYMSIKERLSVEDALEFYNRSFFKLNPDYRKMLVETMVSIHKPESQITLNTVILTNLPQVLQYHIFNNPMSINEFYEEKFSSQLPDTDGIMDLTILVETSLLNGDSNLDKVLQHILSQKNRNLIYASLKSVSAYLACFDDKAWFKLLNEKQRKLYKAKGEKICREALTLSAS